MTNTIPNVPRRLLERASNLAFQTQHYPLHEELRTLLSAPSPADHVEDVRAMVAAAPAAPAADAGIVDMYRHLQKVTPYRFKKIQDASITDGGDVMYFHKDRFDAALLADMAAHCAAKGVV